MTSGKEVKKAKKGKRCFLVDHSRKQELPNGFIVDWNKGMLAQLYDIGEDYLEWIDHPKLGKCRMFDSDLVESFTFTHWWVVPALFIPWSLLEARESLVSSESALLTLPSPWQIPCALLVFASGVLAWTLTEYVYHRWLFHWDPPSPSWNLLHFVSHGMHHLTPADEFRLVFPPALSIPLALMHRCAFYALMAPGVSAAFYGGYALGYCAYESTHYLSHHWPVGTWLQARFFYHSKHHFDPRKHGLLFGVSSQLWDAVFGTL